MKKVVTPAAHREVAGYLKSAWEMSERRACQVIGIDRTSVRYRTVRPDDGALRERLKALAQKRRRFGKRRLHVLLLREGHAVNRKRVQPLYREERLTVRRNVGSGEDLSIADLVTAVAAAVDYRGDVAFDRSKPDGRPRKLMSAARLRGLGWSPATPLDQGLGDTYRWFLRESGLAA